MKKYILPILIFLMFIPFYVNAETCDTDKIVISSITVDNKSENVEELNKATASGKNINLNLSMSEVGDNIRYNILIKNDSIDDYRIDKKSFSINSDFIEYSIESDDNSNIVKAKSSKTIQLKVQYKNEVPEDQFESGTFNYNKNLSLNLSTNDSSILKNPITGVHSYLFIFIVLLLSSILLLIVLRKRKYAKLMILIIGIAVIPMSVYAICECKIELKSNIQIVQLPKTHEVCKKATTLHTTTCTVTASYSKGCYPKVGYGNTITYGTIVNGDPKPGDAYDCDVNNDGIYDSENERFYYIKNFGEKSSLIYYKNSRGEEKYPYDSSGESLYGPRNVSQALPSKDEWSNDKLLTFVDRQIITSGGATQILGMDIALFTYEGKAARLLTYQEVVSACGNESMTANGYLDSCDYLLESTTQYEHGNGNINGYWLETPYAYRDYFNAWKVAAYDRKLFSFVVSFDDGERPVIEVLNTDIEN